MPKISLIIPCYNVEKYLKECINSIINQTFEDFEAIVIDDGSNDSSLNILNNINDKRFKIISTNHKGAYSTRNKGIELSKGEYVQFLDSDDYFEPEMLENLIKRAEKYKADLVVCSSRKVDDNKNIIEQKNPNSPIDLIKTPLEKPFSTEEFKEDIFSLLTPIPWNKLIKKSLIVDNNIRFPSLKIAEDVSFCYSLYVCAKKIVAFDMELINYRYNRPGSMASYRKKYAIDIIKSYLIAEDFLTKNNYDEYKEALISAYKNHIRWETGLLNKEENEIFINTAKEILKDKWELFKPAFKKEYLTGDFLKNFIGNRKVMLYGASFFIQNILKNTKIENILGIIDSNKVLWGNKIGNYKVFSPEILKEAKIDGVIMTIYTNWEAMYPYLKKELNEKYPNINLLENIFEELNEN